MASIKPYPLGDIAHIRGVDHPESISVGPQGKADTTGTGCQVYRLDDLGFSHAYRQEFGDFIRWIVDDTEPCLTWREGLRCVEVMEAAHRSAEEGGSVISLPLYPELEHN